MKKHLSMCAGFICYGVGIICSVYYGLWKMLILPLHALVAAVMAGELTLPLVIACGIRILFSTTLTGLIWCIGYIAYNYFKGEEDPDWEAMEAEQMSDIGEERQAS